jgi:outer membrane protein OmpA-like peptidoglycan-associated protein/plastocyanin
MINKKFAVLSSALLAIPLTGCGVMASNGIDYSTYPIPKLPEPKTVVTTTAPCQMPEGGQPISLEGCKSGDTIVLHGVNFEFNKAALTLNAKSLLDQVSGALTARPDIKVEIDGHTDGKGTDPYNQKLSEARAKSVATYLASHGVAKDRLTSKGFGKTMPIADNATDEGREQNRRVELKVLESAVVAAPVVTTVAEKNNAIVVLEPLPAHANEPGAGIPTSVGVLTHVPNPIEAGPTPDYKNRTALAPEAPKAGPSWKAPAGSTSYVEPAPEAAPAPAMTMPMSMPMSSSSPAPAAVGGSTVAISNYGFVPETLTVTAGTTVTWTNKDPVTHTVKFDDKDQTIATGASFTRTFTTAGTFSYICGIHTSMKGTVVVK